jgi:MSHA biogenesis protein MshL
MKEQGNVNMLSSPKISALNNQKAVIKLTTKEVSWVSSKTTQNNAIGGQDTFTTTPQVDEVGIFLDVTPQIGQDGTIIMQIHPSVSEIREVSTSPDKSSTKPVINVREIDTMVDARTGETIVIAGLISDRLVESKRSVPLLGDIPYLGMLFSYSKQDRAKNELVIMVTPFILNTKSIEEIRSEHDKRMRDMGGSFHLINNLGSLVTEQSSRDWIMRSNRTFPAASQPLEPLEKERIPQAIVTP